MFDASAFTTSKPRADWGSGHTDQTLPVAKGWRCRLIPGLPQDIFLLGIPGQGGCATIMWKADRGQWQLGYYDETPAEVIAAIKENKPPYPAFDHMPGQYGWTMEAYRRLQKYLDKTRPCPTYG